MKVTLERGAERYCQVKARVIYWVHEIRPRLLAGEIPISLVR